MIESAVTAVTVPSIVSPPPANAPPNPPRPGAPLAFGPKVPPKAPPLPMKPRPFVAVDAGAVARPAANATPPTATTSATPSRTLTRAPAVDRRATTTGATAGTTGAVEGSPVPGRGAGPPLNGLPAGGRADPCGPVANGSIGWSVIEGLLLVAERVDGVESGGLAGWPDAEHDAHGEAEKDRRGDGRRVELEAPAGELADQCGHAKADRDPDQPAEQ